MARVSSDSTNFALGVPRLRTTTLGGDRGLLDDLVSFADSVLGIRLLPWQQLVLGDQLAVGADGRPLFRQSLVSVARQNGKTWALKCLVAWWLVRQPMLRGEPQTVLTTAHRLDLASELFNDLAPVLEAKLGADVIWSYGRQALKMPDGSRWLVRAATPSAGHGLSVDLCVVDELFGCSSAAIDDAIIPTMRARRDPLLSMWSTAGDSESQVMLRFRARGMADIDTGRPTRFYLAEFSPPPQLDPMTREAWPWANPALGETIEMETIEEESRNPNRQAFMRASVNCWVQSSRSWLEPGLFESLIDIDPMPDQGGILAVEASTDDQSFVGVRAVDVGGTVRVKVEFVANTLPQLWDEVRAAKTKYKGLRFAIGGSLDLHLPRELHGQVTVCGVREIQRWTTLVLSMIRAHQVTHSGEHLLIEQVTRAVLSRHSGNITVSSARSPGPIELCRAMIWAVAMEGKPKSVSKAAYAFAD